MRHTFQLSSLLNFDSYLGSNKGKAAFLILKKAIDDVLEKSGNEHCTLDIQLAGIYVMDSTFVRDGLAGISKNFAGDCFVILSGAESSPCVSTLA